MGHLITGGALLLGKRGLFRLEEEEILQFVDLPLMVVDLGENELLVVSAIRFRESLQGGSAVGEVLLERECFFFSRLPAE